MNKTLIIIFAVVSLSIPFDSFGQETFQRAEEPAGATTVAPAIAATSSSITPRSDPPPIPIPPPTGSGQTAPAPSTVPAPAPTPTPPKASRPTPETSAGAAQDTAPLLQNAGNNNDVLYAILVAFGVATLAYCVSKFFKKNAEKKGKETETNENCDSIKKLLDQKIKEIDESAKNWSKEKIEKTLKEAAINKFLDEQQKEMLKQAEDAKTKYDKLKEVAEMLQGKYDLCKLELPNAGDLKFIKAEATDEDVAKYLDVEKTAIGPKTYSGIEDSKEAKEEIKNNKVYFIIKNGELAGTTQYEIRGPKHAYLSGLVIIPRFRGQGIARKALEFRLEKLKDMERIDLVTHPDNTKIINLYKSLGFKVESRKENYYGDGEPRLILVLEKK